MIRDSENNNISSFRQDALYKVVGNSVGLSVGQAYSAMGIDANSVSLENSGSSVMQIRVAVKNNSEGKKLQVTVVPCVSSKFGLED